MQHYTIRRMIKPTKPIIDLLAYYQLCPKYLKRVLYNQLNSFFENKLSKFLCGFRRNYSTQHTLFRLLKDWQLCLDNSGVVGTILMDLSKAYDCLPHDLLIAKLAAYGVQEKGLQLIYNYLKNRQHQS